LSMTLVAYSWSHLRRLHVIDRYRVPPPFPERTSRSLDQLREVHTQIERESIGSRAFLTHNVRHIVTVSAIVLFVGFCMYVRSLSTIEGGTWNFVFFLGLLLLFFLLGLLGERQYLLWSQIQRMFRQISLLPMQRAF